VTFSLLFAGLGAMIASLLVRQESTKMILLVVTAVFYVAAALQIMIYKYKPKAFDDKKS
jgi:archaellum biogenesis protein FlaJ (TadC family)